MMKYAGGGVIPGKVPSDMKNRPSQDTVKITATPGEIVIPLETIAKGPDGIMHFVMGELQKNYPNAYKEGFDDGGTINRPVAQVNDAQKKAFSSVNRPAPFESAVSDAAAKVKAAFGFPNGGTVPSWDSAPPTADELDSIKEEKSWDAEPPHPDELKSKKESKESSVGEKLQTGLENFGNAAMLGYLPQAQAASAPLVNKVMDFALGEKSEPSTYVQRRDENIARIKQESEDNPKSAMTGAVAGTIASAGAAPELPFLKGAGIMKGAGRGAAYGLGYGAAQNPGDIEGQTGSAQLEQRAKNAGVGALMGAPTGALLGIFGRKAGLAAEEAASQNQSANASARSSAGAKSSMSGGDLSVEQGGSPFKYKAPKNLDELNKWTPPSSDTGVLAGKDRLQEIENILPDLQTKPLQYHYDMMDNPKSMKDLKLKFENLPTDSAKKIAAYNQSIVDESADKVQQTIHDITGDDPKSISDSGHDLISKVKDKYDSEKDALGPIFDQIQKSAPLSKSDSRDLAINIGENSKIGKLMNTDPETGRLSLAPNTPRTGLSDQEHSAISRVIDDLNDGMTFKEMQDAREFLRKQVDPANPNATPEINKVRSLMLGQLGEMAKSRGEDVGAAFKDYAVNEKNRENVEKIIGGKISDLDKMYAANPENVVKKVFSNPNYSEIVGNYVGDDKMKEMAQSYIQNGIQKSFDSANGFDPSKMRNWLKSNSQFISNNVDPDTEKRLSALADYGYFGKKFLSEVNPSGTAASLKEMVEPGSFFSKIKQKGFVGAAEASVADAVQSLTQQRQAVNAINEALGTKKTPSAVSKVISSIPKDLIERSATKAESNNPENKTLTGPAKWQNDGFNVLMNHAENEDDQKTLQDLKSKLQQSPKGQRLLTEASMLKPGKNRMKLDRILSDIKGMK